MQKTLSAGIYLLSVLIGVAALVYPFVLPSVVSEGSDPFATQGLATPALTIILLVITLGALLLEVQGEAVSAKTVAALGVLVAATSILRFVEVAIPGPGGFSPIFVPIILCGYVFGARFGFLMGTMTMLVSALITGGIGPWLPYQMFVTGWVGLTAGWLPHLRSAGLQLAMLAAFAFVWGLLYGAVPNLFFWPFMGGGAAASWQPGSGLSATIVSYATFYVASSLVWDVTRAVGNAALILLVGLPAIRALQRFHNKSRFEVVAA
jgi:energy-coupling factor transport system substrate-specific component